MISFAVLMHLKFFYKCCCKIFSSALQRNIFTTEQKLRFSSHFSCSNFLHFSEIMAPRKDIDLNNEANDDLDTTLCMGKDKGKRPIEESPEKPKKRKRVSDEDMEEISTGRSSEDKIARLEKKIDHMGKQIEDLKKMAKRQDAAMTSRIDRYFYWSTHSFSMQTQRSVDCMTALYNSLYEIAQAMGPRNGQGARNDQGVMVRFNNPGNGAPSTSRRPPRP